MSEQVTSTNKVADAVRHSWVYNLPEWLWPYAQLARWERPIGWQLLMWPCWWSLALAWNFLGSSGLYPSLALIFWFLFQFWAGSFLMRGAGCTYNDLVDQDIDDKVARTRSRPLPSGRVTKRGAIIFLAVQLLGGLLVLLQFNLTVIALGIASLVTVLIYPFMKRVTWWPQLFLGFAFSWGALVGWWSLVGLTEMAGHDLWFVPVLLYAGSICWVIGYDTIYAHQDIEDDALVGVKSTARLFGESTRNALITLFSGAMVFFAIAFFLAKVEWPAWVALAIGAMHMTWQVRTLDIHNPAHCLKLFKSNSHFGLILFAGLIVSVFA